MKTKISILLIFISSIIFAQNYTPYNKISVKSLKLEPVAVGTLADSVLVLTPAGIVKQVPSSSFGMSIPHLEYNLTDKTVWNNGKSNIDSNTSFGDSALKANTTGENNDAFGLNSLATNTTGFNNVCFGNYTLYLNTTGRQNSAFGQSALSNNTTGYDNSAFGGSALLLNTTGYSNNAFGYEALVYNNSGANNSAFGHTALYFNSEGNRNTAIGAESLKFNEIGSDNNAFGSFAGSFLNDKVTPLTDINSSIFIGNYASAHDNGNVNEIVIGGNGNGSNSVTIGNPDMMNNYFYGDLFAGSFSIYGATGKNILLDSGNTIPPNLNFDTYYLTSTGAGDPEGNTPIWQPITGFAPIDHPTFTGTVTGIDKTMVGLGNVDNTADIDKPVSIATQSVLDSKTTLSAVNAQNLSSFAPTTSTQLAGIITNETGTGALVFNTAPTFSGIVSLGTATCNTLNASTGILVSAGISPQNKTITIDNTDNTSTISGATFRATTGGSLSGDPSYALSITSNTSYSCRLANTDGDKYKEAFDLTGTTPFRIVTPSGETTMPLQPSFSAYKSANTSNVTGDGTAYTTICDSEIYDQNADYDNATGTFTAPVTGRYMFTCNVQLNGVVGTHVALVLSTSNRPYNLSDINSSARDTSNNLTVNGTVMADMDAGDIAVMRITVFGGTKTTAVFGTTTPFTFFSGFLMH